MAQKNKIATTTTKHCIINHENCLTSKFFYMLKQKKKILAKDTRCEAQNTQTYTHTQINSNHWNCDSNTNNKKTYKTLVGPEGITEQ